MKKYDSYKDSCESSLGDIPTDWNNYRLDLLSEIVRGNTSLKKDELLDKGEYVALQYGKTYKVDEVNNSFNFFVNNEFYKQNQIVKRGNTIIISTSETLEDLGHSCFYNHSDLGLVGGEQILLKPNSKLVKDKYLYYYSKFFCRELRKYGTGLKVFRFNTDDLKKIFLAIPSLQEQTAIAQYLDTKTHAIDKKVNLLEKKIGFYKELRKSIINETVTKGLDKSVKLKDSGIDWIGQIPEHWELKRLKDVVKIYNGYGFPIDAQGDLNGTIPFYKVSDINGSEKYLKTSNNSVSIKTCRENGWKLIPKNSIIVAKIGEALKKNHRKICIKDCLLDNNCMAINTKYNSSFFFWLFVSIDFATFDNMGTIPSLSIKAFNSLLISFPPIKEQSQIATYLDHKTQTIDKIVRNIQTQIATLKELRKTLINDVVTGKIKVVE